MNPIRVGRTCCYAADNPLIQAARRTTISTPRALLRVL
jgi:hypothetical protein